MAYRIHYAFAGCMMRARLSGRSSLRHAGWMARDIRAEASRGAAKHLLIDVRGLQDRLGTLGALVLGACPSRSGGRMAVLDSSDNDRYHPLSEGAARWRGHALRYFGDPAEAMRWLEEACRGCSRSSGPYFGGCGLRASTKNSEPSPASSARMVKPTR